MANLRTVLDKRMNTTFAEYENQMARLSTKTENRLNKFDEGLKKVEADTVWRI